MIKGAIFDLDGTLLDSMSMWETIGETYLRSIGYEPKENLAETFKTLSLYQAACYYRNNYGVKLSIDEIMLGVNNMIKDYYINNVLPKANVVNFLDLLKQNNIKMCIATANDKSLVEAALSRCKISSYFMEIFTCTDVGHGKDEPAIYRTALRHLGTKKSDTLVLEDAFYALQTAKNDNFVTVAVYDKYEKHQSKINEIADYKITDYKDIEPPLLNIILQ